MNLTIGAAPMLNKLICFFKGHKRGKRINAEIVGSESYVCYQCPRCKAKWAKKGKHAAA